MSQYPTSIKSAVTEIPLISGKTLEKIGYVVNYSFHIWYKVVMNVMRERAAQYGISEVLIRDAQMDIQTELKAMDELIDEKVDILIVTPVASPEIEKIVQKAKNAGIPLVLEANPVEEMTTMVAICDYDAGVKAGKWTGEYAEKSFEGVANVLDIAYPPLRPCLLRSEGFLDGLRSVIANARLIERVNGEAMVETSRELAKEVIQRYPEVNIVFGMDDESIHGGLKAVEEMGIDPETILLAGFGMAGDEDKDHLMKGGPWKVSTAMFPEWVGLRCVDQAVNLYSGHPVNKHDVTPTFPVTKENLPDYYTKTDEGWIPKFKAIAQIEREGSCSKR
jgi:ribose transport system substrate-binding protein